MSYALSSVSNSGTAIGEEILIILRSILPEQVPRQAVHQSTHTILYSRNCRAR